MNLYVKFASGGEFINFTPANPEATFDYIDWDGAIERHTKHFSQYLIWATTNPDISEHFYTSATTIAELHLLHPEVLI